MTLVIFDVDGTLIYSERRDSLCFATAYEEVFGREFPTIDWRQYPHVTDTVIFETVMDGHFQRKPSEQELQDFHGLYLQKLIASRKENPHFFKEVPGARSLVERLSQMEDVSLAIATGGWKLPAEIKLEHVGIPADLMPISAADGQYNREDILRKAIQLTERAEEYYSRIVYIGDAIWDVATTRNLNMRFIGVRYREDHDVLLKIGARHVVSDYQDQGLFMKLVEEAVPPLFVKD
jgi:phosphoglycolate phosphatase-like HAD superfamily hydrolase